MKRSTARLLRGVLRLMEDDLRDVADSVVEVDEREAKHYGELRQLALRVDALALLARDTGKRATQLERRLLP